MNIHQIAIFAEMDKFEEFIVANEKSDTSRLLLSVKSWPAPEFPLPGSLTPRDLAVCTIDSRKKLARKVPQWHALTSLAYVNTISAEQCSSTQTATYKASLARKILNEHPDCAPTLTVDLTGGMGVDSWAFSKVSSKVIYNEMNPDLAAAAGHNFPILGMDNVTISCAEVKPGNVDSIIGDSEPGLIFLDPARRASDGKKVFLLEDCQPDVLKLVPELFGRCRHILLKLSPMADISMVRERLEDAAGKRCVREIHVVAFGGECKELLIWMDREHNGEASTICCEDGNVISFDDVRKEDEAPQMDSTWMEILFEPGKSLTKAGVFSAVARKFHLAKLARFTHLYAVPRPLGEDESKALAEQLGRFGKVFTVSEVLPLNKAAMKEVGKRFPKCEVSARNIPLSSDELRSRLKVGSGNDAHIFGARIELPYDAGNHILVCQPFRG